MLNVVLKAQPRAIWLSFGADLRKWLKIWREMEQSQQRQSHVKAKVFISVGSVKEAREVLDWDEPVDVIVAQGQSVKAVVLQAQDILHQNCLTSWGSPAQAQKLAVMDRLMTSDCPPCLSSLNSPECGPSRRQRTAAAGRHHSC